MSPDQVGDAIYVAAQAAIAVGLVLGIYGLWRNQ